MPEQLSAPSFDQQIDAFVSPAAEAISSVIFYSIKLDSGISFPLIVIWLVLAGFIFTLSFRFLQFWAFKHAIKVVRGDFDKQSTETKKVEGEVSHFQALTAALSGTVGLGNIAGVAIAIATGGPGATIWMIIAGLLGMMAKFVECTLGVKYRKVWDDGTVSGGPMYYILEAFSKKGLHKIGWGLAVLFAVFTIGGSFGGGNMFQSNQATEQLYFMSGGGAGPFADQKWIIGLIMAVLVGAVTIGGMKRIASVTDKMVPAMCALYVLCGFLILGVNYERIPAAFSSIIEMAFTWNSAYGGLLGALLMGFKRASFSNEAGVGSASIVHSTVKTDEPVSEGMVALLEPFIDTVVICTVSALLIVVTGVYQGAGVNDGIAMTSKAFSTLSPIMPYFLAVAVVLFAFSTMISWSYYGMKAATFIFGEGIGVTYTYQFFFCVFVILGSSTQMNSVVNFSDAMIFAMSVPNLIACYMLLPELKKDLRIYLDKYKL
jgi:AGCS family alanine or glycine:cation symporter